MIISPTPQDWPGQRSKEIYFCSTADKAMLRPCIMGDGCTGLQWYLPQRTFPFSGPLFLDQDAVMMA